MKEPDRIPSHQITPLGVYLNRRMFMRAGIVAGSVGLTGYVYRKLNRVEMVHVDTPTIADVKTAATPDAIARGFYVNEPQTPLTSIANYNNFYEFTTNKEGVAHAAAGFVSKPWQVAVQGM